MFAVNVFRSAAAIRGRFITNIGRLNGEKFPWFTSSGSNHGCVWSCCPNHDRRPQDYANIRMAKVGVPIGEQRELLKQFMEAI